jgi:hypothetical protein
MRRICSFVPAVIVTNAAQPRPEDDVPSRARRRGVLGIDPITTQVDAAPGAPPRRPTEPSS